MAEEKKTKEIRNEALNHTRRRFLGSFAALGAASVALPGEALARTQEETGITKELLAAAEKVAGLSFNDAEREMMLENVTDALESFEALRAMSITNEVPPALHFNPVVPGARIGKAPHGSDDDPPGGVSRPKTTDELVYMTVAELAELLRTKQISPVELTHIYLDRLKQHNDVLECVITFTEARAIRDAQAAEEQITRGNWRGPLHGIPWGAKDLLTVGGYPTTWGAMPYRDQSIEQDAWVVDRLDQAGAVLIAKTTLGALAWGDVWFGGKTRNPWDLTQGSSGSSAGSASATAAGCVGFAIGSETWGSIVSPSTICGTTGLRPTFGTVARTGAMALSWSMDKLGPLARSVEDCAYIFSAVHGSDPGDPASVDRPFTWRRHIDPKEITIGYVPEHFEEEREGQEEWLANDKRTLDELRQMGFTLKEITFPQVDASPISFVLSVEAAAAFDELTRTNMDDELVRQVKNAWPNVFRAARMIPGVEYIQANRARTLLMHGMAETLMGVDCYISPSWVGPNLLITNLTGHPAVVLPNGFRSDGTPTSITFNGHLFDEARLLAVANAWQQSTDYHRKHPDLEAERREYARKKKEGEGEK